MNGRRRKRNKTTMNITGDKNQTTSSMNKPTSKKLQTPFFYLSGLYNSCISKRQCFFSPGRHTAHCIKCEYSVKYYQRRTQRTRSRGGGREEDTRDGCCVCFKEGGEEATDELSTSIPTISIPESLKETRIREAVE